MGKLSALREAALALEGGYEWYYMGFYIHDCVKMRYKAEYKPQMVLDQGEGGGKGKWVDLGKCVEPGRSRGGGLVFDAGQDADADTTTETSPPTLSLIHI